MGDRIAEKAAAVNRDKLQVITRATSARGRPIDDTGHRRGPQVRAQK
jgi:hypothetical protein